MKRKIRVLGMILLAAIIFIAMPVKAESNSRIHVLTLPDSDAILLESNGRFGLVDSGEDLEYPDGTNARYPQRVGITKGIGHEQKVIAYLKSLGVTADNLEFYIGTHPHSDHIGSADEIITTFRPSRVYIMEYSDKYIKLESRLWDNLFVYDDMIQTTQRYGLTLIQEFSADAPVIPQEGSKVGNPNFQLGDMQIEILNYSDDYKTVPKEDANDFSLGVKVTVNGRNAFLAGDIGYTDGDEDALADVIGEVDFLKLGHHGRYNSSSVEFLETLSPAIAVQTGNYNLLYIRTMQTLNRLGTRVFPVGNYQNIPAIVINMNEESLTTNVDGTEYFGQRGATPFLQYYKDGILTERNGFVTYNEQTYYFFQSSQAVESAWITVNGKEYYLQKDGTLARNQWIDGEYYVNGEGVLQYTSQGWEYIDGEWYYITSQYERAKGWQYINSKWYYFDENGVMITGWCKVGNKWYYLEASGAYNETVKPPWNQEQMNTLTGYKDIFINKWYHDSVYDAQWYGLMSGRGNSKFAPEVNTTRCEVAAVIFRLAGAPETSFEKIFTDVNFSDWYAPSVIWGVNNSVIYGYGNGYFGANDAIKREDLVSLLYRYSGSPENTTELMSGFKDSDTVSDYAKEAMEWAIKEGIIYGVNGEFLNPKGFTTRAELAAILVRYYEKYL